MTRGSVVSAAAHTGVRIFLCAPVGIVVALLCATIFLAPLGLLIGAAVGAWCTAPLRRHPQFNVNGDAT